MALAYTRVGLYFSNPPDEVALCLLAAVHHAQDFAVSKLPQTDWVSHVRRTLAPVHVGRFFLYGGHDADKIPPDVVPLRIEAAMAFGTGHHYTTAGVFVGVGMVSGTRCFGQ